MGEKSPDYGISLDRRSPTCTRSFGRTPNCGVAKLTSSQAKAREAGKLRIEGKEYVVQDGDVINFRFNV